MFPLLLLCGRESSHVELVLGDQYGNNDPEIKRCVCEGDHSSAELQWSNSSFIMCRYCRSSKEGGSECVISDLIISLTPERRQQHSVKDVRI